MARLEARSTRTVITDDIAEELAHEAEAGYQLARAVRRRVGRPSLHEGESPRVQFRVPPDLYAATRKRAEAEGKRVSEVAREALARYVRRPAARIGPKKRKATRS